MKLVLVTWLALAAVAATALALDTSKGVTAANHARAHRFASGAGVTAGILDSGPTGIQAANHLGDRIVAQLDFQGLTPEQTPQAISMPNDNHETLVADIVAGDHQDFPGVAPGTRVFDAAVQEYDSLRAATAWLSLAEGIRLFNLSAGYGVNDNGVNERAMYLDWFTTGRDALVVKSAGNTGGQITIPGDFYNGITVGAMDESTLARWTDSAYRLEGGAAGSEVRGKPDILAPGVDVTDGSSYSGSTISGTSFAAPHVTGTAALLTDFGDSMSSSDALDHRGLKVLILNSARKREISGPEASSAISNDSAPSSGAHDRDYLQCNAAGCAISELSTPGLTAAWTPAGWSYNDSRFSATKPLDDEQGVGFLDATRAITNLAGGNFAPGSVAGIGWDQDLILTGDDPLTYTYALDQALAAGSFLTATLAWDRIVTESDGDGIVGDGIVEDADTYAFSELANLDLRILGAAGQIVAESISPTDSVEHLHVPLPADGGPGDYRLQVIYNGGGSLATDFALAWWASPAALVPGDYNLDGLVDADDYQVWRANFATSTMLQPLVRGDGNGDGLVDAADYTLWRDHMGQQWANLPVGLGSALATVPEPGSVVLAGLALVGWIGLAGRRSTDRVKLTVSGVIALNVKH